MPKIGRIIVCLLLVVGIAGCTREVKPISESSSPQATKNTEENNVKEVIDNSETNTSIEDYTAPSTVPANLTLLYSHSNGPRGWFIYSSQETNEASLFTFYSKDKGSSWNSSKLTLDKGITQKINKENIFVSIPENEKGLTWVLITSDPGAGLMKKQLYSSTDEFKSWSLVADVSNEIDGYVTGVSFINDLDGWITASYHGKVLVPLYRTKDGGGSWDLQNIDVPKGFKYGNVYPLIFDSQDLNKGSLKIDFVGDKETKTFEYKTTDFGENWKI